ncbi:glycosyl transferase [Actinomycetota bacterium]|nr:glycosyl transferase [Actinomycetota bacterium]
MSYDISVVIPAYNESETISYLNAALNSYVAGIDYHIQFVFVDDGSQDDTIEKLRALKIEGASIKIVKLSRNYGSHAAIRAGIANSDADNVMIYSMDMPEPVEDIGMFRDKLLDGNEIVYSERIGYKGSLGSRIFAKMINRFIEKSYPDSGLIGVGFGSKVKKELNNNIENSSSVFFQIFQLGFKRVGMPVEFCEREQGESKWTFKKKVKLLIDSFVMFSFAPIRVISLLGVVLALIGVLWALAIIIIKLFNLYDFAAGWPTTISVLLIGFGITNLSLGVIAEYLSRTLEAARHRPVFIVDEVIESDNFK